MKLILLAIVVSAIIAIIACSIYLMLSSINKSVCQPSSVLEYESILKDFNGSIFKTDSGRYSAEIIVRSKIEDYVDKLVFKKSSASSDDVIKLDIQIDFIKKIDESIVNMRDDVIHYMLTTSIIEDKPTFIALLNDKYYITIIDSYSKRSQTFGKWSSKAKTLVSSYNNKLDTASMTDEDVYKILLYG